MSCGTGAKMVSLANASSLSYDCWIWTFQIFAEWKLVNFLESHFLASNTLQRCGIHQDCPLLLWKFQILHPPEHEETPQHHKPSRLMARTKMDGPTSSASPYCCCILPHPYSAIQRKFEEFCSILYEFLSYISKTVNVIALTRIIKRVDQKTRHKKCCIFRPLSSTISEVFSETWRIWVNFIVFCLYLKNGKRYRLDTYYQKCRSRDGAKGISHF